jgi:hypothetical protein
MSEPPVFLNTLILVIFTLVIGGLCLQFTISWVEALNINRGVFRGLWPWLLAGSLFMVGLFLVLKRHDQM